MAMTIKAPAVSEQEFLARGIQERAFHNFCKPLKRYFRKAGGIYFGTVWGNAQAAAKNELLGGKLNEIVMLIDPFERMQLRIADVAAMDQGVGAIAYSDEVHRVVQLDSVKVRRYRPDNFKDKHVLIRQLSEFSAEDLEWIAGLVEHARSIKLGVEITAEGKMSELRYYDQCVDMDTLEAMVAVLVSRWVKHQSVNIVRSEDRFDIHAVTRPRMVILERRLEIIRSVVDSCRHDGVLDSVDIPVAKLDVHTIRFEDGDRAAEMVIPEGGSVVVKSEFIRQPGRGHWAISRALAKAGSIVLQISKGSGSAKWTIHDWASSILCEWLKQHKTPAAALTQLTVIGCSKIELEAIMEYVRRNGGPNRPLLD